MTSLNMDLLAGYQIPSVRDVLRIHTLRKEKRGVTNGICPSPSLGCLTSTRNSVRIFKILAYSRNELTPSQEVHSLKPKSVSTSSWGVTG